jgi:tetratricopeptide (TPR) repeat protein
MSRLLAVGRGASRLAVCASLWIAVTSRAASPPEERPVALPPFIVEEATKGPPWRYAEVEGYEILSRCDDKSTRRVVEAHYKLHQLLADILPPELQVKMSVPRALILYDNELQPAASREVITRMLRNMPEPPTASAGQGAFRPPASMQRFSFLPNLRLWDRDSMAVFMIVRRDDFDADRLSLTHDYVSYMVKSRVPALPVWFIHGFLTLYRQIAFGGDRLSLERLQWISGPHTDALKKDPKSAPPVTPLADFLALKLADRGEGQTYEPMDAWQAQAALFVRWGLDANNGAHRAALWKFTQRCAADGVSETVFRECFGFDFAEAQVRLAAYLPIAVTRTVDFRPTKLAKLPPLPLRNATDGQIARLKGDWERLEVPYVKALSPELAPKYLEQARRTLKRGYERDERDPRLLAVLGLCECDAGNDAVAREYLEAAARIGPMRPRAQYELARLRLAEFRAKPDGAAGGLSVGQTAEVLRPLFAARAESPPLPEVYELIAHTWASSDATPTRGHLAVLDEGVRLFPRRTELWSAAPTSTCATDFANKPPHCSKSQVGSRRIPSRASASNY